MSQSKLKEKTVDISTIRYTDITLLIHINLQDISDTNEGGATVANARETQ